MVVLDNASFHKSAQTKELIEQHGAKLLFLPPYSPDLNPIEHDFGALKKIREYNHEKSIDEIIIAKNGITFTLKLCPFLGKEVEQVCPCTLSNV